VFTLSIDNGHGIAIFHADSEPDIEAIKECIFFLWKLEIGLVDCHDRLLR